MNLLNQAIQHNNLDMVKNLIEVQGYSPSYTGSLKTYDLSQTPMVVAAKYNTPEIMNYLIEKGADVNAYWAADLGAPLSHALWYKHVPIVSILLANNATVNPVTDKYSLAQEYLVKSIETNDLTSVENLLKCEPSLKNTSVLNVAFDNDNLNMGAKLIEMGFPVDVTDKYSQALLVKALKSNNMEWTELLLNGGAEVNLPDSNGNTPLIWALSADLKIEMIELLVSHGANVNQINYDGLSALDTAINNADAVVVDCLISHGADLSPKIYSATTPDMTPLEFAVTLGDFEVVKALLEGGSDIHHMSSNNKTALNLALEFGHIGIANMLNTQDADSVKVTSEETHVAHENLDLTDNDTFVNVSNNSVTFMPGENQVQTNYTNVTDIVAEQFNNTLSNQTSEVKSVDMNPALNLTHHNASNISDTFVSHENHTLANNTNVNHFVPEQVNSTFPETNMTLSHVTIKVEPINLNEVLNLTATNESNLLDLLGQDENQTHVNNTNSTEFVFAPANNTFFETNSTLTNLTFEQDVVSFG